MLKKVFPYLFVITLLLSCQSKEIEKTVTVTLLETTQSWNGKTLPKFSEGQPKVTISKITIPPKTKLPKQDENPTISLIKKSYTPTTELTHIKKKIQNSFGNKLEVPKKLNKAHKCITATKVYHDKLKIRNKKNDWRMKIDTLDVISIDKKKVREYCCSNISNLIS